MKVRKLIALGLCAAMVSTMTVAPVLAEEEAATEEAAAEETTEEEAAEETTEEAAAEETTEEAAEEEATDDAAAAEDPTAQFEGLVANEAYEFPMMVKSFQSTYWVQLRKV